MQVADQLGVVFTFFLSAGRSISRRGTIRRMLGRKPDASPCAEALSARRKLGSLGYISLAIRNPLIGAAHPELVRDLFKSQDMGLHGGRNHDIWHHDGQT